MYYDARIHENQTKNLILTALKIANFIIQCSDILISAVSLSDWRHTHKCHVLSWWQCQEWNSYLSVKAL